MNSPGHDFLPRNISGIFTKRKGRLLVLFLFFVVYPYTIIGIVIDMEVATATAFIVCFDTTTEIVYVIVKSYLCE